jgi:hypothetical protein
MFFFVLHPCIWRHKLYTADSFLKNNYTLFSYRAWYFQSFKISKPDSRSAHVAITFLVCVWYCDELIFQLMKWWQKRGKKVNKCTFISKDWKYIRLNFEMERELVLCILFVCNHVWGHIHSSTYSHMLMCGQMSIYQLPLIACIIYICRTYEKYNEYL